VLLCFIVLAPKSIYNDSKKCVYDTYLRDRRWAQSRLKPRPLRAACFVNAVFSGFLRIFLGKVSLWSSFSLVLRLRFVSPMYLCSQHPHGISQTTPRGLLAGTASFPEARTILNLITGLKVVRIRCLPRIRFKILPKSAV